MDLIARYLALIAAYRTLTLASCLTVLVICFLGLPKLQVSSDNRIFYSDENRYFQDLLEFEDKYLPNNNILILISADTTLVEDPDLPHAIRWLESEAWKLSHVIRVDSIASYPIASSVGEDVIELHSLLDHVCPDDVCLSRRQDRLGDPAIVRRLISSDGSVAAVLLTLELELGTTTEIQRIYDEAAKLRSDFETTYPRLELRFTGGIPMMHAFGLASAADLNRLVPIALLISLVLLLVILRNISLVVTTLSISLFTGVATMGVAGHVGYVINTATAIVPLVLFTLTTASAMHLVFTFSLAFTEERLDTYSSVLKTLQVNLKPTLLTAGTSILGFMSMNFADAPPLGELGILVSVGILIGSILLLVLAPLVFLYVEPTKYPLRFNSIIRSTTVSNQPIVQTLVLAICVISVFGVSMIRINDDFVRYFSPQFEFRQHSDYAIEHLSGPNHIELDYRSNEENGIYSADYRQTLSGLVDFLRSDPRVSNVLSIADVFAEALAAFEPNGDLFSLSSDELAQLFLAYELSLWYGQTTSDLVSAARSSSRVSILLNDTTSLDISRLESEIRDQFARTAPPNHSVIVTGENIPVAHMSRMNFMSMVTGIVLSLTLACALTALGFRSLYLSFTAVLATLVPIAMGFGLWGWFFSEIGLAAAVITAVTLGLIIDDAIHMIARFRYEIDVSDLDNEQAAIKALVGVGQALITTSIVLGLGFGVLAFSAFGLNNALGVCTVFVVVCALLFDLSLLPRLLARKPFRVAMTIR